MFSFVFSFANSYIREHNVQFEPKEKPKPKQKPKDQPKEQPKPTKKNSRKRKRKIKKRKRPKDAPRKITNFTVVPQASFKRHHICIDNYQLFEMVKIIDPERVQKSGKKKDENGKRIKVLKRFEDMKKCELDKLWREYIEFDADKHHPLERKSRKDQVPLSSNLKTLFEPMVSRYHSQWNEPK